ncbi:Hypothetical_protein [Hexamita inflata]|uniref:Hypothetical_protein n=1 Tax=Hexamita inflata TaxID=28002 RepID=A0AA86P7E5_9EUKA|nr:Hypothetical protein HINF_LOCUS20841 [Hexamita inflata]
MSDSSRVRTPKGDEIFSTRRHCINHVMTRFSARDTKNRHNYCKRFPIKQDRLQMNRTIKICYRNFLSLKTKNLFVSMQIVKLQPNSSFLLSIQMLQKIILQKSLVLLIRIKEPKLMIFIIRWETDLIIFVTMQVGFNAIERMQQNLYRLKANKCLSGAQVQLLI